VWAIENGCFFPFVCSLRDEPPALQFTSGYFYNITTELRCTLATRESSSLVPWALVPGAFFFSHGMLIQCSEHAAPAVS
jgi:hypothetical protein